MELTAKESYMVGYLQNQRRMFSTKRYRDMLMSCSHNMHMRTANTVQNSTHATTDCLKYEVKQL